MKRAILFLLVGAVIGGGAVWLQKRGEAPPAAAAPEAKPADEEPGPKVSRDTNGNAVISMSDEIQGNLGIQVTNPAAAHLNPEVKGYGRVQDPAPLAALMNELASAQAAQAASSSELARLKTLTGQGNASTRALQAAAATSLRDQLAVQSVADRLALSWGKAVSERKDLPAFSQSLASQDAVVVRIDLPAGDTLSSPPTGAHIVSMSDHSSEAELLGPAPAVDPQMQGQGFLFLIKTNASHLTVGEAVVGYLKAPGEPLAGVVIPRDAVVRTESKGWVYVLDTNGAEAFVRTEVPLDQPTAAGWFVTKGVSASDYVVVNGAQQLLSIEMKGQGSE